MIQKILNHGVPMKQMTKETLSGENGLTVIQNVQKEVQSNLDLRKILGVTKIFLKPKLFFISNTENPLKITNKA